VSLRVLIAEDHTLVSEGLDVRERIAEVPTDGETPEERVYMETVTILADGEPLPGQHIEAEAATEPTPTPDDSEE
jgi:hypothetical protein